VIAGLLFPAAENLQKFDSGPRGVVEDLNITARGSTANCRSRQDARPIAAGQAVVPCSAVFTTLLAAAAMLLTLALPTFPDGLTIPIVGFLGLVGLAGLGGFLRTAAARAELAMLAPWLLGLGLGLMVGLLRGNPLGQALEDALPYMLFALGLCAGRGASRPGWLLAVILLVCLLDGVISLVRMPSFDLGRVRSTFNYFKIIAGHLLVGVYCAAFLHRQARNRLERGLLAAALAVLVLAIVATVSRGMVLGLVLGLLTALYVRRPARGLLVGGVGALLVLLFTASAFDFGAQYLRLGNQSTVDGRVREIGLCLEYFVRMPVFGAGLGAEFVVDGFVVSYVHNMLAYHLWKFGLVGSALFALPVWGMARQRRAHPGPLRGDDRSAAR
jgi:O-antigen ligase